MVNLDKAYWNTKYEQHQTNWDAGGITTPLKDYFDQLKDREMRILIPGGGNGYEAEYLHSLGFHEVHILDIADKATALFRNRVPDFPKNHIHNEDFFEHRSTYDLIVEQTFFCALDPKLRKAYARMCYSLLKPKGKIVGVLWDYDFGRLEPPFGGTEQEYRNLFEVHFNIEVLELCHNSIKPRVGRELFIKLTKDA